MNRSSFCVLPYISNEFYGLDFTGIYLDTVFARNAPQ